MSRNMAVWSYRQSVLSLWLLLLVNMTEQLVQLGHSVTGRNSWIIPVSAMHFDVIGDVGVDDRSVDLLSSSQLTAQSLWTEEQFDDFGWEVGGSLHLDLLFESTGNNGGVSTLTPQMYVFLVSHKQGMALSNFLEQRGRSCAFDEGLSFTRIVLVSDHRVNLTLISPQTDLYSLVLVNCEQARGRISGSFTFLGPQGEQLGFGQRLIPEAWLVICLMYMMVLLAWMGVLGQAARARNANVIHWLICVVILLLILDTGVTFLYWRSIRITGRIGGTYSAGKRLVEDLANMASLAVALLLGGGMNILRRSCSRRERNVLSALFSALILLMISSQLCLTESLCNMLQVLKYVVESFILIGVVISMNCTILALRGWLQDSAWESGQGGTVDLYAKFSLYKEYRVTFVVYLLLPTLMYVIRGSFFPWQLEWGYVLLAGSVNVLVESLMLSFFAPSAHCTLFLD